MAHSYPSITCATLQGKQPVSSSIVVRIERLCHTLISDFANPLRGAQPPGDAKTSLRSTPLRQSDAEGGLHCYNSPLPPTCQTKRPLTSKTTSSSDHLAKQV